jgi:hypothetical protein
MQMEWHTFLCRRVANALAADMSLARFVTFAASSVSGTLEKSHLQ